MKVNKAIYVIVALFLGGLGIHKFYADKFGTRSFSLIIFSGQVSLPSSQ